MRERSSPPVGARREIQRPSVPAALDGVQCGLDRGCVVRAAIALRAEALHAEHVAVLGQHGRGKRDGDRETERAQSREIEGPAPRIMQKSSIHHLRMTELGRRRRVRADVQDRGGWRGARG